MSSTRKSSDPNTFKQERYCSSSAYDTGLKGNHVTKRVRVIEDPEDRALIYFLQQESHKEGGLERVAEELLEMFPERVGTPTMVKLGKAGDDTYTPDEVRLIRDEMPDSCREEFPLDGDEIDPDFSQILMPRDYDEDEEPSGAQYHTGCPDSYPVRDFHDQARLDASELADHLKVLCLDPSKKLDEPYSKLKTALARPRIRPNLSSYTNLWNFCGLVEALYLYRRSKIEAAESELAETEISQRILDAMDYALETKTLVIIEGLERMGKSVTARNFCARHPGKAIYMSLESGFDEKTFFRSIAKAIGVSSSSALKAIDMRVRIEDMLQQGDIVLVIDEAWALWPQLNRVRSAPKRIDWLRLSLVDKGVPVVLVSTPQFYQQCDKYEKSIGWNSRQLKGRVKHHELLPAELSSKDLEAIARHKLPDADNDSIRLLREVSESIEDYVAGIERVVTRANYFAKKQGKDGAGPAQILSAVEEIIPEEPQQAEQPKAAPKRTPKANSARGYHNRCKDISEPVKAGGNSRNRIRQSTVEEPVTT
ncbi:hypothetical protein DDZ13_07325 [Coraliomargarita sinensis]|uniref:ORC1/DEAH AAA+ ATPase domain-containing protein n=1 Tax=Coraliomargarita sinensis TaxID=2174842 RepID=A0A317ZFJ2_9BACT|nr:ATP-binding protein [Coraliomargarita sinensis]PXA04335.1 hypothetical protein DDZ13_07325 [Coraliomargarita sinensis]